MRRFLIYAATIIAFFIVGVIVANFIIMPLIVHMGKEISVPNVCLMELEKAIEELEKHDLQGVVVERRYDPIIEEGKVITQEPLPDAQVKQGRIINLAVSLGPETVRIPFLTGVDIEKGQLILKRLGLITTVEYVYSDSILKNKIIETEPDAETELKKGDKVQIVVSKGLVFKMPNVTGMDINEARDILEKLDLVVGEVKEVEGSGVKGSVIIQSPAPDQQVDTGDTVSLMVIK
jgi:beta-lactam-binding protein with PASTA domain